MGVYPPACAAHHPICIGCDTNRRCRAYADTMQASTANPAPAMNTASTLLRQWQMLLLIPRYPARITVSELVRKLQDREFSVGKRTVERDLHVFETLFALQVDDREKPHGWSWPRHAEIWSLPAMNDEQAITLYMLERHLKVMLPPTVVETLSPLLKAAREKLKTTTHSKALRDWPDKVRALPPTQPLLPGRIDAKVQEAVSLALLNNQWLEIRYLSRGKAKAGQYIIQPLTLVLRGAMFYLACRFKGHEDDRFIALNRVEKAVRQDETFTRPQNYDIDAKIAQGWFGFGQTAPAKLELLFQRATGEHLVETPLAEDQHIEETADGRLRVRASVPITPQLKWWILAFAEQVEVIKPISLRREIAAHINQMTKLYVE